MSDSSETNLVYKDKNGSNLHIMNNDQTSSTTMHFGHLANMDKAQNIIDEKPVKAQDSDVDSDLYKESNSSSDSDSSSETEKKSHNSHKSSEPDHTKIDFGSKPNPPLYQSSFQQPSVSGFTQPPKPTQQHTTTSDNNYTQPDIQKPISHIELKKRKIEMLRKLAEIKDKGYDLSKEYNINSDLEEMEIEHELLKSFATKKEAVTLSKSFLKSAVGILEFLNDKYDPFSFELGGWSKQVVYDCEEHKYDDVIGEIYDKYRGSGKAMEPELRLSLLLIISAGSYHTTKSKLKPKNDEDIIGISSMATNFGSKMLSGQNKSRFKTSDEIRIEQLKMQQREKERQLSSQRQELSMKHQNAEIPKNPYDSTLTPSVEISGPKNVGPILDKLKAQYKKPVTNNESDSDRKISENLSEASSKSSKRGRPKKKATTLNLNI
jgi:hypothetical protein